VLERALQWVSQDLLSAAIVVLARTEETLSTMIFSSLAESENDQPTD
jgi:hypothetical protein